MNEECLICKAPLKYLEIDLNYSLSEILKIGKQVSGGAGISTGMFMSIALKATPLAKEVWELSNQMTARALDSIGKNGGPRCCKRGSYLAVTEAVKFTKETLGIAMKTEDITCSRSHRNNQCIGDMCPFKNDELRR